MNTLSSNSEKLKINSWNFSRYDTPRKRQTLIFSINVKSFIKPDTSEIFQAEVVDYNSELEKTNKYLVYFVINSGLKM